MNIEIREVIKRILGDVVVHCETYHDEYVVYKNLDNYSEALDEILDGLGACNMYAGDYRYSANLCGSKAKKILEAVYERIGYFIGEE